MPAQTFRMILVLIAIALAALSLTQAQERISDPARAVPRSGPIQIATQAPDSSPPKTTVAEDLDEAVSTSAANNRADGLGQIRLHLRDGSTIAGDLSVDAITVETAFGVLNVPVDQIKRFTPGLDSYPDLSAQIHGLFEELGADDYQKREQAHKDLVKFGLKIRNELDRFVDDENAERKRHLAEIRKELEELAEELDEFNQEQVEEAWIRGDTVVTTDFTIVGRIAQDAFTVTSKYGPLTVKLSDVQMADRTVSRKAEISRSLQVGEQNLVQREFKSSGIRVHKGDKIIVRADGQLTMSPWGGNQTSTPDGSTYYGWYVQNEIPGGALVAKIGSSGRVFNVGSKQTIVAPSSGLLHFAIAMQHQYANQGYNYPGQYNVRVKVQPK